ncbi:MAG: hypothetical protein D6753_01220 [Planctomycetota bacterium]|nr:MAG: hypothetical protein D6753_01220 [Planctomycetota bacterium]
MNPEASYYQFPREVWQTVNECAWEALARKEFAPDASHIESLRCVYLNEETESEYGRQIWFFEANGTDPIGRFHRLYGALDFSVEYGLMVPVRAMLMRDPHYRQRFLQSIVKSPGRQIWNALTTRLWVRLTLASVFILSAIWLLSLAAWLMN